jgi:CBS domain-containing membrane protein
MNVRDLMTRDAVTLRASDRLDLAEDIMSLGRIRHLPVMDGERVVGIVSQRDLFRGAISSALELRPAAEREWLRRVGVREVMTTRVVTIAPGAPLVEAVRLMVGHQIGCLPVVEGGRLCGLISETDCMRYLARLLEIAEERLSLPASSD